MLGDLLVRRLDMPVAFASVAIGGSSVKLWQPGTEGYDKLKHVLTALGRNGARAALWHQGENDVVDGMPARQYEALLTNTIRHSRVDAGYDVAWFVANVGFVPEDREQPPGHNEVIRSAQRVLWEKGIANQGPDTDELSDPKFRSADRLHFSDLGLKTHAERWFAVLHPQLFS